MNIFRKKPEIPPESMTYSETESTRLIEKYNKFWFLCCCPDFWVNKVDFSDSFVKFYRPAMLVIHTVMVIFCTSCFVSLWTQHGLSQSQESDRLAYAVSTPIITIFYQFVIICYTNDVRNVLYNLAVVLKEHHDDKEAEQEMIKKSKLHNGIFFSSCLCNMLLVGCYNCFQAFTTDATFITCISAWPDMRDRSTLAGATRVLVYFLWLLHVVRNMGVFLIFHTVLLLLTQQYRNLQGYFENLNKVFDERQLSQEEMEEKFELRFKKGIEQHALTLWCVEESQRVFLITFSSHVLLWCGLLISILPEVLNNDTHDLTMLVSNAPRVAAALVGLGYFMWPAGDITVEASNLPHAMYGSGWQNCHKRSPRIRKLAVLAMMQAQRPIELKAFGHLTFSYETYVAIVKMSYSLFSVLY
uniref:Odorant receptor n=2 Tax=Mythimna separata TaxID=271217 RepID=A0A7H1DHB6_MYTSE|nr:olfactory receptor 55 [Mythimna separata]